MHILAGDIGGTKTSLAIFETSGGDLEKLALEHYPSQDFDSLDAIVRRFVSGHSLTCKYASFGIAGPVQDGQSHTTNLPWHVNAGQLAGEFGFRQVWLMNDLEANAWGLGVLQAHDFCVLNSGRVRSGNAAIISAGTGLGEAGLFWDGNQHLPYATEGGHADFSPASDQEIALLNYLRQRFGHVSWERVVSGSGLVNIHDFLREYRGVDLPQWLADELEQGDQAAAISAAAHDNRDPVCTEALEMFVYLYGVEAGNHALHVMATGGVYIGGGIAPKLLDWLSRPDFMRGFCAKGRMQDLMQDMPVRVILNPETALYGPAVAAVKFIGQQ